MVAIIAVIGTILFHKSQNTYLRNLVESYCSEGNPSGNDGAIGTGSGEQDAADTTPLLAAYLVRSDRDR